MKFDDLISEGMPDELIKKIEKDYIYVYALTLTGMDKIDLEGLKEMNNALLSPLDIQSEKINTVFNEMKQKMLPRKKELKEKPVI